MMISVNQPYFFPFVSFFYKAYLSDNFVILDDVQFPRGTTWITRNRFKNSQGNLWMTVPVIKKGLGLQKINAVIGLPGVNRDVVNACIKCNKMVLPQVVLAHIGNCNIKPNSVHPGGEPPGLVIARECTP